MYSWADCLVYIMYRSFTPESRHGTPGSRTPTIRFSEDDYGASLVSDELAAKLTELVVDEQVKRDSFSMSVQLLASERNKVSIKDREDALVVIYTVISHKYEPERVNSTLVSALIKAALGQRSDLEALLALQSICVAYTFADEDHPNYEDINEQINSFLPKLLGQIREKETTVAVRSFMTTALATLIFFTLSGGGGFNVEPAANNLMEIAETTTSKDAAVTAAALLGLALVTTLARDANSLIEDLAPSLTAFLGTSSNEVKLAAGKILGVFFEKYTGTDLESEPLVEALESVLSESSKRTAKKDKRQTKSLFRDVLRTQRKDPATTLTYFALSRQKSLPIRTWAMLALLQHLTWAFAGGIQSQIANNAFVHELLREETGEDANLFEDQYETPAEREWGPDHQRAVDRRIARLEKIKALGLMDPHVST